MTPRRRASSDQIGRPGPGNRERDQAAKIALRRENSQISAGHGDRRPRSIRAASANASAVTAVTSAPQPDAVTGYRQPSASKRERGGRPQQAPA